PPCARHARLETPRPRTGRSFWPAPAATDHGGAALRRSSGRELAGSPMWSPAGSFADLQGQPINFSVGQVLVSLFQVAAGVGRRLMGVEGILVAVQLVEDALQRLAIYQMRRVDECSGLIGLNGFDGLGYEPVVSLGADLVLAREAHAQTEHRSPSGRVTPCSHSMCLASTPSHTYLLYVLRIPSTLSVGRLL